MNVDKCLYCDSIDTTYCSLCGHSFCDRCKKKYPKRIASMIKEKIPGWLTREEYDERLKKEKGNG